MFSFAHAGTLLVNSVALMTMAVFMLSVVLANVDSRKNRQLIMGLSLGVLTAAMQKLSLALGHGEAVDPGCLIVGVAAGFFGARGLFGALIPAIIMRIYIGDVTTMAGLTSTVLAGVMGYAWWSLWPRRITRGMPGLLLLGLMISLHLLTPMFFLARDGIWAFYSRVGIPLGISEIAGAVIFGSMIRRETALHALRVNLDGLAHTDPLTGLPNRRSMKTEHTKLSHAGIDLSILYIDIDHFKEVNDRHGHAVGDAVLCEVTRIMRSVLKPTICLARLGGEEFAVLLPDADLAEAVTRAEDLRRAVNSTTIHVGSVALNVSVSIGVHHDAEGSGFYSTLQRADRALYLAKTRGRNQIVASNDPEEPTSDHACVLREQVSA